MKDLKTNLVFLVTRPLDPQGPPCHRFSRGPIYATGTMVGTITVIMQGKYCQKFVGKISEKAFINCFRLF